MEATKESQSSSFRVGVFQSEWGKQPLAALKEKIKEILEPLDNLEVKMIDWKEKPPTPQVIDDFDALIVLGVRFPASCFEGVKRLKCIARWGVGFDRIDVKAATAANVAVSLTVPAVAVPVAEGALTMAMTLAKNLRHLDASVRKGGWRGDRFDAICVKGRTLGTIGVGNIGKELCRTARGLGFGRLLAFDPYIKQIDVEDIGVELVDIDTVLKESDFVFINVPLNEATKGLIGEDSIKKMKSSAYLINTSRGGIIDEKALFNALKEKKIGGAALDVFEVEPVEKDNPLLTLDNVILAPHSVAWTEEIMYDNSKWCCINIREVYYGRPPKFTADRTVLEKEDFKSALEKYKKNNAPTTKTSTPSTLPTSPGVKKNSIKEAIKAQKRVIGHMILDFTTKSIPDILSQTGLDFVVIDMEHSGIGLETVGRLLRLFAHTELTAIVRVPVPEYHFIARVLDLGAQGVMIANVKTVEETRKIIDCAKYAPKGNRGLGLGTAHNNYRAPNAQTYLKEANDMTCVIIQIESQQGVDNAEEIAKVEGVDVLWVGHFDMTSDMGICGEFHHPKFLENVNRLVQVGKKHGKGLGVQPNSISQAREWIERGFDVISYSADIGVYKRALTARVNEVRRI